MESISSHAKTEPGDDDTRSTDIDHVNVSLVSKASRISSDNEYKKSLKKERKRNKTVPVNLARTSINTNGKRRRKVDLDYPEESFTQKTKKQKLEELDNSNELFILSNPEVESSYRLLGDSKEYEPEKPSKCKRFLDYLFCVRYNDRLY